MGRQRNSFNPFDNVWAAECGPVRHQHRERSGPRDQQAPWGGPMGGPPPWISQFFGPGFGGPGGWSGGGPGARRGGGGGRGGRGPRVRRGDVRSAILDVLAHAEEPLNGYQVIQEISAHTDGAWKPSPGSVYPTIAVLVDEGLLEDAPTGRKALQLTDEGRAHVEEHAEQLAGVWKPFEPVADDAESADFKQVIGQTVGAIVQVVTTGTPDQRQKALEILAETRRKLYGLLAEGPDVTDADEDDLGDADSDLTEE